MNIKSAWNWSKKKIASGIRFCANIFDPPPKDPIIAVAETMEEPPDRCIFNVIADVENKQLMIDPKTIPAEALLDRENSNENIIKFKNGDTIVYRWTNPKAIYQDHTDPKNPRQYYSAAERV